MDRLRAAGYGLFDNEDFLDNKGKNGVKYIFVTCEGEHVWAVWRWSLVEFVLLLFRKK